MPWILLGLLTVALVLPWAGDGVRRALTRHWSRLLMTFCGVRVEVCGQPRADGAVLWVANHVSWLDIFALNLVRPIIFVAKSEIRRWPVIGWLVAGAGTVFIERGHRHAIRAVGDAMKQRFAHGEVIGLFPEGTTSPGDGVLPFHTSLFDAAIRAQVDIQPVALRFYHRGRRSDRAAFVGEQTLVGNLWEVLGTTGLAIELVFLPEMPGAWCAAEGRAAVAAHAREAIAQVVATPAAGHH